jgi:integrase
MGCDSERPASAIGSLRWSEIDSAKALLALPGSRTKNGRPHDVPLSTTALEALSGHPRRDDRDFVFGEGKGGFSGWSKAKAALDEACGVEGWTLHDLRRTAATRMADVGVLPHVIEAVLNHVSGHRAGVAGIYNRSTYATEKRAALELWANHLMIAIAQAGGSNVTKLKRRK